MIKALCALMFPPHPTPASKSYPYFKSQVYFPLEWRDRWANDATIHNIPLYNNPLRILSNVIPKKTK